MPFHSLRNVHSPSGILLRSSIQVRHAETENVTYNLVAAVNHTQTGTDQGYHTTISLEQFTRQWYKYDDDTVQVAKFINSRCLVGSVKMDYQQSASILFYINDRNRYPCHFTHSGLSSHPPGILLWSSTQVICSGRAVGHILFAL
jgi:hypothetical protein